MSRPRVEHFNIMTYTIAKNKGIDMNPNKTDWFTRPMQSASWLQSPSTDLWHVLLMNENKEYSSSRKLLWSKRVCNSRLIGCHWMETRSS
mmetsp:Transcript_23153/g.65330  ORF Transcript_23153/g.65330 Transcript_23153/m.65330 type:complete len:90 (-) Transcript_23153:196-465(-)